MIIFNEEKIKYEHLDSLLSEMLSDVRFSSSVNVVIDLKEIFKKVFRPNIFPSTVTKTLVEEITSDIIGVISHYRNYFFKQCKYTTFYFLYSEKKCEKQIELMPEYKSEHYEKYYSEGTNISYTKERVLNVLNHFFEVIPNVNYIDCSEVDDVAVLKFLTSKFRPNELSILFSNDFAWFQVLRTHIIAINCKGIKSQLITFNNAVNYIAKQENTGVSAYTLPLILAISGYSKYSLKSIRNIGIIRATMISCQLLGLKKIEAVEYLKFPLREETLDPSNKNEKLLLENFEELKRNYDVISANTVCYSNTEKIKLLFNKPKKKITFEKLMEINSKLFYNFPINLEMLIRGEKL